MVIIFGDQILLVAEGYILAIKKYVGRRKWYTFADQLQIWLRGRSHIFWRPKIWLRNTYFQQPKKISRQISTFRD